jgi:hypothetical protein
MTRERAFRKAADSYRLLLRTWTEIGSAVRVPNEDDAILERPPAPGEERSWLERLVRRAQEWVKEARESVGARRDRIVRRLRAVLRAGLEGAKAGLQETRDMIDPIKNLQKVLDTEFGAAFGGGLAIALAIAAVWLLRQGK